MAPIAVEILLCRGSAQKIETDSGKKLLKNKIKLKLNDQQIKLQLPIQPKITTSTTVIPKTRSKPQKPKPKTPGPYDPQHPYKEAPKRPQRHKGQ